MAKVLDSRLRKNLDVPLILAVAGIAAVGIAALASLGAGGRSGYAERQAIWVLLGAIAGTVVMAMDYNKLDRFTKLLYVGNMVALTVVLALGHDSHGATRWISIGKFQYQPSEFAKLVVIVCLATHMVRRQDGLRTLSGLLGSLAYVAVPMLAILAQPDLGTALVLLTVWFVMAFVAGARLQHLGLLLVSGIVLFSILWHTRLIHQYQKDRLSVFINPGSDPRGAGYHLAQSIIAVGAGEVTGQGYRHGSQTHGGFIPENQTDFAFTIVAEETGFVGALIVVGLYAVVIWRIGLIMLTAGDTLGRLMAAGVFAMFAYHTVVNIGMTIGIMPVTGVPLPMVSSGGSSTLLTMMALGLVLGVGGRRHGLVF